MDTITNLFKAARRVSTPLIGIQSADPAATIGTLKEMLPEKTPIILWNCVDGFSGGNNFGETALDPRNIEMPVGLDMDAQFDPVCALQIAKGLTPGAVVFFQWMHKFVDDPRVVQAIWNLRDSYKAKRQTCVILSPDFRPPAELSSDMVLFEEALPLDEQLGKILDVQYDCVKDADGNTIPKPEAVTRRKAVEALRGLPAFTAEQAIALSMTREGINLGQLWDMKRASIENIDGLQMYNSRASYADLGGLEFIKRFHEKLFAGKTPPSAIIHIDEIEKAMAGASGKNGGDSSGTSDDQLGTILTWMEDEGWSGVILVGAPGTGKTAIATSTGPTFEVPSIRLDLGACKGSLVGESERKIRAAMKTIKGIAGNGAYFIATANQLENLRPELRRRFRRGIWYIDLPTPEELKSIWTINIRKYGLDPNQEIPAEADYTGADVRNICDNAYAMGMTLVEAAETIVPVSVSDPDSIKKLRELAAGRFLDASRPGKYTPASRKAALASREYQFEDAK